MERQAKQLLRWAGSAASPSTDNKPWPRCARKPSTPIAAFGGYVCERVIVPGNTQHDTLAFAFRHLVGHFARFGRQATPMVGIACQSPVQARPASSRLRIPLGVRSMRQVGMDPTRRLDNSGQEVARSDILLRLSPRAGIALSSVETARAEEFVL